VVFRYLIDQFLNSSTNRRTDEYGGSIENRSRFLFEILDACLHELPASKLAIRLSPDFKNLGVKDTDPVELFSYVLTRLQSYKLAYIQVRFRLRPFDGIVTERDFAFHSSLRNPSGEAGGLPPSLTLNPRLSNIST
jgi:2,4-dienoyl-CoA reductase-like NADH-dependent reductase (Old Yellow Enzyme family)